jgi:hypothetical protein
MARIYLKSQRDPFILSYERALKVKELFDLYKDKKKGDEPLELEDFGWSGTLSRISEIFLDFEKPKVNTFKPEPPMSDKEREYQKKKMMEIRKKLFGKKQL